MKIKDLGAIIKGRTPPTGIEDYWNGDIPFVTTKDLQTTKYIHSSERYLTKSGLQLHPKNIIPPNAVCVSCTGILGYVGITTKHCMTNQQIISIVPDKANDPEYIYYLMKSMWDYFKQIEGHSTVTSQISKDRFSDIDINIPELSVQREIVETLNAFDDLLEVSLRKAENLRKQLKLIFGYYTSGCEKTTELQKICTIKSGVHNVDVSNESNYGGDIKLLNSQDIRGTFVTNTSKTITEKALEISEKRREPYNAGSIVMSYVGTIGQTSITTEPMCATGAVAVIIPRNSKMTEYIYTYLISQYEYLNRIATGSVMRGVNINSLKKLQIPVLSDEQTKFLSDIIHPLFEQLRQIHDENIIITSTRDIAIKKYFENTLL